MMGASKRIMELFLMSESSHNSVSMARFANVAYSDGSLLHGFTQRYLLEQPLSAPKNIRRYFISQQEAGELCLLTALLANNREIFFPKLDMENDLISFTDIAKQFLALKGYKAYVCSSEDEARSEAQALIRNKSWPVYFFDSETTGEKEQEIFWSEDDDIILDRYDSLGVIMQKAVASTDSLKAFEKSIQSMLSEQSWTSDNLIELYRTLLPSFNHKLTGTFLDDRM
jgi:FlaA1/EpsC-like NDP-sugar epimerase